MTAKDKLARVKLGDTERAYIFVVDKTRVCDAHVFLLVINHVDQRCLTVVLSIKSYRPKQIPTQVKYVELGLNRLTVNRQFITTIIFHGSCKF